MHLMCACLTVFHEYFVYISGFEGHGGKSCPHAGTKITFFGRKINKLEAEKINLEITTFPQTAIARATGGS